MTALERIPPGLTPLITLAMFLQGVTLRLGFLATMDVLLLRMQSADHNIHSHNKYRFEQIDSCQDFWSRLGLQNFKAKVSKTTY